MMKILSERIKMLIKANGMSQAELAKKIGVSAVAVTHWVAGGRCPSSYYLGKIADVFGCSTDYLLGRTDES